MDPILQEQYDNYFELFRTKGWKQFIEDVTDIFDGYSIENIKDAQDLSKVQGERKILKHILSFQWGIENNYELLQESLNDDPQI